MNNTFKNDVHVRSECRFADEAVFIWSDPNKVFPVEVPVVLLEIINDLAAVVDSVRVGLLLRGRLPWALILCMCWRSSGRD